MSDRFHDRVQQSFPEKHEFAMDQKNEEQVFTFEINPPNDASDGIVTVISEVGGVEFKKGRKVIEYDHIPTQTLFPNSQTRVVKLEIERNSENIGYIMGAGDAIPHLV